MIINIVAALNLHRSRTFTDPGLSKIRKDQNIDDEKNERISS